MNKNINIPGRLHSVATDGQVAGANEIYDDEQQKFQGEINAELHEEMEDAKGVVDSFDDRVKAIEDLAEISIEGGEVQVANTAEEIVAGSGKVPTANAVAPLKEDILLGAVYDVSAKNPTAGPNNDGKWESLAALLLDANLNTLIPTAVRKGGMSIKFVQSSDNNYVQYFYTGTAVTGTPNPFLYTANWEKVNIEKQIDEVVEDVVATSSKVTEIESLLKKTIKSVVNTTYSSGYINSSGGVNSSSYGDHSDFVEIEEGKKYYIKHTASSSAWNIGYYTESNESSFISGQRLPESGLDARDVELIIPPTAHYFRITKSKENTSYLSVEYNELLQKPISELIKNFEPKEVYYVRKDGLGDYTSIVSALQDLKNNEIDKVIYILGGEYDILEEMGGQNFLDSIPSDVQTTDWPEYSNFVPNNTVIKGLGEVILNFIVPNNTSAAKKTVVGPLAFRGNVCVENITINAKNCRYCIHDETGGEKEPKIKKYKNIILNYISGPYGQCYGAGHSKNSTLVFENCVFKSYSYPVWSVHDNSYGDYTTILISNCAFISRETSFQALRFGTLSSTTGKKTVQINNCSLGGGSVKFDDDVSMPNRYELTIIKSGNPTISSDSGNNPFPPLIIPE